MKLSNCNLIHTKTSKNGSFYEIENPSRGHDLKTALEAEVTKHNLLFGCPWSLLDSCTDLENWLLL